MEKGRLMNVKQVILVRKDIKMPKGKLAAQVSHASMAVILDLLRSGELQMASNIAEPAVVFQDSAYKFVSEYRCVEQWLNNSFTKVCLGVDDLQTMESLYRKALAKGIPCSFIVDEGRTCFNEPTATCCGIGPWHSEQIDEITGDLKLL
jgi:PTH2 family peptidyl-tRNA hydrolase